MIFRLMVILKLAIWPHRFISLGGKYTQHRLYLASWEWLSLALMLLEGYSFFWETQVMAFIKLNIIQKSQQYLGVEMSVEEIILDPITILEMSTYYEKNQPRKLGATFGLLYAQQVELKYRVCLSAPLGTDAETTESLVERSIEYEALRLKRSKSTINFYEQFTLIGAYIMRSENSAKQDAKLIELSRELSKRAAPYYLIANSLGESEPKLFKNEKQISYATEMERNQKLCIDSMYNQNSKTMSIITKTIEKQKSMIDVYNQKLQMLISKLEEKDLPEKKKLQIMEIIDSYQRISKWNQSKKAKTMEAMNYSILVGIGLEKVAKK